MSAMVERVAKALCQADGCDPDHESADPSDSGIKLWTRYERDARAAIEAMREPDAEVLWPLMILAVAGRLNNEPGNDLDNSVPELWEMMINAALKEPE